MELDASYWNDLTVADAPEAGHWRRAAANLAALERSAAQGVTSLVKIDGGRNGRKIFTVVVQGGALAGALFHEDADDLEAVLARAVAFLEQRLSAPPKK
jgi:hypothetical protein